jgi:hypothetical protein
MALASTLLIGACVADPMDASEDHEGVDQLTEAAVCRPPECEPPPVWVTCYTDRDHDGHYGGRGKKYETYCPSDMSLANTDCNDNDGSFWANVFHLDNDHDGFGAPGDANLRISCAASPPVGMSSNGDDCDDSRSEVQPRSCMLDDDGDGYWTQGTQCSAACPVPPKPIISIQTSAPFAMLGQPFTATWTVTAPPHCRLQPGRVMMYDGAHADGTVNRLLTETGWAAGASGSITGIPNVTDVGVYADFTCETAQRNIVQTLVPVRQVKTSTTLFNLRSQPLWEGFVPYSNVFTLFDGNATGHMRAIQNFSTVALLFVKPGHSSNQCGDSSAVVVVPPNGFVDMNALFGVPQTNLPLGLLACRAYDGTLPSSVLLSVTYDYLE